jgi:uncharacterized protein (DUF1800 family)
MLAPLAHSEWSYAKAAHLLNRAGFGGSPAEIAALTELGPEKAVASFFNFTQAPGPVLPEWARPDRDRLAKFQQMKDASDAQRMQMRREQARTQREALLEFRQWWLRQMAFGPAPLQEKLVLFWHGHFATSAQKVRDTWLMTQQNALFRRHAAGNWLTLLTAVSKDPAMLLWLDQAQSLKEHPNENFAREVMELFTLGEGRYSEQDVTEAARAFTGWSYDRPTQQFQFRPRMHDAGAKTVLGKTGTFNGDDVLRIIVSQPQAAEFIVRKLWVFFASENPSSAIIRALADEFRRHGNEFRPVLELMFLSRDFYANDVMRQQVKSPAQWLVGSVRLLGRDLPPPLVSSQILRALGQDLFLPPNVKGWDGGLAWITTNNLLNRYNTAHFLVFGVNPLGDGGRRRASRPPSGAVKASELLPKEAREDKSKALAYLQQHFIQGQLKPAQEKVLRDFLESVGELEDGDLLHAIHLVMATPEYQLA